MAPATSKLLPAHMGPQMANTWKWEPINYDACNELLADGDLVERVAHTDRPSSMYYRNGARLRASLTEYTMKAQRVEDEWCVKVHYVRQSQFGRVCAKGPSLQTFPRPIRYLLSWGKLYDVDIAACIPTLMCQYLTKLGMDAPSMTEYTANVKAMREALAAKLDIAYDEAKILFQCACTGSFLKHPSGEPISDEFLLALHKEGAAGVELICKENSDLHEHCKMLVANDPKMRGKNAAVSCASRVLLGLENACLRSLFTKSKTMHLDPRVPVGDGFMPVHLPMQAQLRAMQDQVFADTGFKVSVVIKEIPPMTVESLREQYAGVVVELGKRKRDDAGGEAQQPSKPASWARLTQSLMSIFNMPAEAELTVEDRTCDGETVQYAVKAVTGDTCCHDCALQGACPLTIRMRPSFVYKGLPVISVICNADGCGKESIIEYSNFAKGTDEAVAESALQEAAREWQEQECKMAYVMSLTDNDRIFEFNVQHAVCTRDARYYTIDDSTDDPPIIHNRHGFNNVYETFRPVVVGYKKDGTAITEPFPHCWSKHGKRRTHKYILCIPPPLAVQFGTYNTWRGFAAEQYLGRYDYCQAAVDRFIKHNDYLVNFRPDCLDFQLQLQAQMMQYPGQLAGVAIVSVGLQGSGKSVYVDDFMGEMVIGRRYYTAATAKNVFGQFNSKGEGKILITLPEIKLSDSYEYAQIIKKVVTDAMKELTKKGVDSYDVLNFSRLWASCNPSGGKSGVPINVAAGEAERRLWLVSVSNLLLGDEKYFKDFWNLIKDPQAIMSWYIYLRDMEITISNFQNARPATELYTDAQQANIPHHVMVLHSLAASPMLFTMKKDERPDKTVRYEESNSETVVITSVLLASLVEAYKRNVVMATDTAVSPNTMGKVLTTLARESATYKGIATGITKRSTKMARFYDIDRKQLKAYLEAVYRVDDEAEYLTPATWPVWRHMSSYRNDGIQGMKLDETE